ncbi:MAG TPA: hypothetical protein VG943_07980 [Caulobacterales bacterium]|nr:hypothetical protein [Caulobacterales bacterium]
MLKLAVLTTLATTALVGAASAQTVAVATAQPAVATTGGAADMQSALTSYAEFHSDVSDLKAARITTAADLETALDTAARHNRDELTRGWVAYGAMTAAQSAAYAQGVRDAAAYYGRDAVIWAITADPYYARGLRGASEATKLALDSANADGARIIAVADRYQEMAYSLQRQRWANAVAPQQAQRVQRIRALGAPGGASLTLAANIAPRLVVTPASLSPSSDPTAFGGRRFWDALRGGPDVVTVASAPPAMRVNGPRGEAVARMTSIAALEVLGATSDHASAVSQLMNDQRSRDCFEMAQLQLYQCMSAAHFRYENAFCLGQHGLRDVGLCISAVAEPDPTAMAVLPTSAAAPAPAPASRP